MAYNFWLSYPFCMYLATFLDIFLATFIVFLVKLTLLFVLAATLHPLFFFLLLFGVDTFEMRVFRKQSLYFPEVVVRYMYTLPVLDPTWDFTVCCRC